MIPVVVVLLIVALFFIFVPLLPPGLFVFAGYLIYSYHTDFAVFNSVALITVGFFCVLSLFIDNVLTLAGTKIFRASKLSIIGMLIGMLGGFLIGNIIGMLIGIFVGAFIGEFVHSALFYRSLMAAVGAITGYVVGVLVKLFIIGGLILYFVIKVFILTG